jgi:hypothetical protein
LEELTLGGSKLVYNKVFSYKGLSLQSDCGLNLKKIKLKYCSKIGTKSLEVIANTFNQTIEEIEIVRNCLD